MKHFILFFLCTYCALAQESKTLQLKDSVSIQADTFLGVDTMDAIYYTKGNTLYKNYNNKVLSYQNIAFNRIVNFDCLNPLALTLFYQDFNTVVRLDSRLAEIKKHEFNSLKDVPIISHASTSTNHRLWLFNENNLQLGVFNGRTNQFDAVSQPISEKVIAFASNYNFCWVLTPIHILEYNNYGTLISRHEASGYDAIWNMNAFFILKKENELFLYDKEAKSIEKLRTSEIKIKDVFVKAETVYIYNGQKVYTYNLKLN